MLAISGLFADMQQCVLALSNTRPDIILIDQAIPGGCVALGQLGCIAPQIPVVVIAVTETAEEIIFWAEAGVAGYIPKSAGIADVVPLLIEIRRGNQACSASVAASLMRRISSGGASNGRQHDMTSRPMLTLREAQVAQMVVAGMSNKDIARALNIGVATAKTHVHHLLGKLNLQRRGQAVNWMRQRLDPQ